MSGIALTMWEVESIHDLSSAYVCALHEFKDTAEPPFIPEESREKWAKAAEARLDKGMANAAGNGLKTF